MYFCTFDDVKSKITQKEKLFNYIQDPKTFIVKTFPYYVDDRNGNVSKYARGLDYHVVVQEKLSKIIESFKHDYPENNFVSFCDNSPLPEAYIAFKSGAGTLGRQGLIFDKTYGGYIFIGIIATDLIIDFKPIPTKVCSNCGMCVKSCPTNSILNMDFSNCLSHITQSNGEIDKLAIKKSKLIWGCDICLDVCPMNKAPKITDINEFKTDLVSTLYLEDVENLTRNEFKSKFPDRAFTFRGPKPILRNLKIKSEE